MNAVVQPQQQRQPTQVAQKLDPLSQLKRAMYPQIKALAGNDERKANALFATAVRIASDPKIMECTQASIIGFFTRAIDLGLNLDPAFGEVYPIPYKNYQNNNIVELQFQLGAKGYAALARELGGWDMQVIPIFDCDTYKVTRKMENGFMVNGDVIVEFDDETREKYAHDQDWCFEHLRCVMANARRLENGKYVTYSLEPAMTKGEINRRRLLSSNQQLGKFTKEPEKKRLEAGLPIGIWHTHFLAMAEKTALGALAKKLPKSRGVERFLQVIEEENDAIESTATVIDVSQKPLPAPTVEHESHDDVGYAEFVEVEDVTVDTETGEILSEPVEIPTNSHTVYTQERYVAGVIKTAQKNNDLVAFWETVPDDIKPKYQTLFEEKQDSFR